MHRPRRLAAFIALTLMGVTLSLTGPVPGVSPSAAADTGPTIVGHPCAPDDASGIDVVVDFTSVLNEVHLGCAPAPQANGISALAAAGFSPDSGPLTSGVCQIDGVPAEGYPTCWYEGYWSYWRSDGTAPWSFSPVGPSSGPLVAGSAEGWAWHPGFDGPTPRVAIADLSEIPGPDCAAIPRMPTFDIVSSAEVLPVRLADGGPTEVAVIAADGDAAAAAWSPASEVDLADHEGSEIRVLARRAGAACAAAPMFDATYDVRAAYAPRWDSTGPGAPSPAVDKSSDRIVGWASGHTEYTPGPNVNPQYQVPENGYGPVDSSVVILGDRGTITMTFDAAITDGPGADLAVFENGFAYGDDDYLELARVEVSSDGATFARFDSASRRSDPVGSFVAQAPGELGGVAGKDLDGKGTPFDLAVLATHPEVRSGAVDLSAVTHVRLVDILGDGTDLDSFGRPIFDPHPTSGSGGFDLKGIAVLNAVAPEPTSPSEAWTRAGFEDLLDRAPTAEELAAVVERLDAGTTRRTVARELATSDEWLTTIVTRMYADTLGRAPDAEGLGFWTGELRSGRRSVAQVAASFYASGEYYRGLGGGTPESWVSDLYDALLDRAPDTEGLEFWTGRIEARGRGWVALQIFQSIESRRARVQALYGSLLGRTAEPSGLEHWAGRVLTEGDITLAVHLASSAEYLTRAQVRFP